EARHRRGWTAVVEPMANDWLEVFGTARTLRFFYPSIPLSESTDSPASNGKSLKEHWLAPRGSRPHDLAQPVLLQRGRHGHPTRRIRMFQVSKRSWLITAGLVLGAAALAPKSFAGGPRLVAQIDEPFEVNGQLFPAGKLSLREVSSYTPVSTLNELQVDGRCLGMVLAQEIEGSLDAS